jgi:hypothetical protein
MSDHFVGATTQNGPNWASTRREYTVGFNRHLFPSVLSLPLCIPFFIYGNGCGCGAMANPGLIKFTGANQVADDTHGNG